MNSTKIAVANMIEMKVIRYFDSESEAIDFMMNNFSEYDIICENVKVIQIEAE